MQSQQTHHHLFHLACSGVGPEGEHQVGGGGTCRSEALYHVPKQVPWVHFQEYLMPKREGQDLRSDCTTAQGLEDMV